MAKMNSVLQTLCFCIFSNFWFSNTLVVVENDAPKQSKQPLFPKRMEKLFAGAARMDRDKFMDKFDVGVPKDKTVEGNEDVLILYHHPKSVTNVTRQANRAARESLPSFSVDDATIKCHTLKVVLTEANRPGHCMAIVGQWESYHIHKYMRVQDDLSRTPVSLEHPFRSVARTHSANKGPTQRVPSTQNVQTFDQTILKPYLDSLPSTLEKLQPIAEKVGQADKTIIALVCNLGQSELLVNFICHAKAHNFDLSRVLVFCTDLETKKIVESFGLTAFHDEVNFDNMPVQAARSYGDRRFTGMMMAKVFSVHMLTQLNYNVLFQDVDVVWYRHPLEYFQNRTLDFDMYFQDDGAHSFRYAPYSPNTGFYFVKAVDRTRYFFNCFIKLSDLIQQSGSHQSALTAVLNDHVSYRGLKVKILSRDDDEFPGGFHFHRRKPFMKQLIEGKKQPYVFHMSWTTNKENKRHFFQQLGDWYNSCKSTPKLDSMPEQSANACCSAEPIIKCHYRDKPSRIPCKDSPSIDKNKPSWW